MFKSDNTEQELYQSMEKSLLNNQAEEKYGINKLAKAADYLNSAARIFEKAGMHSEANEVINVLQDLTKSLIK